MTKRDQETNTTASHRGRFGPATRWRVTARPAARARSTLAIPRRCSTSSRPIRLHGGRQPGSHGVKKRILAGVCHGRFRQAPTAAG